MSKQIAWTAAAAAAVCVVSAGARATEYCVECSTPPAVYRCAAAQDLSASSPQVQLLCASELSRQGGHESCSVRRQSAGPCDGPLRTVTVPPDTQQAGGAAPDTGAAGVQAGSASPTAAVPMAAPAAQVARPAPVTAPVPVPAAGLPPTAQPMPPAAQPQPLPQAALPSANVPPATVEEAAKGLVDSSQKGLQQAGSAVVETTEKTAGAVTGTAKSAGTIVVDGAKAAGNAVGKAGSAVGHAAKKSWDCMTSLFSDC